jgi:hypothetical protein
MADFVEDDVGADIRAAIEGLSAGGADAAPSHDATPAGVPETGEADVSTLGVDGKTNDQRARDESGRFAPKPTDDKSPKAEQTPELAAPTPGSESSPGGDITIPRSLSPEAKAQFATWPELARNEFLRREADTARGVEKLQQELRATSERYSPLEAVIAPHREKWQLHGMDDARAIQALVAAQNFLEKSPAEGIAYLARQYGVQFNGQAATPAPQADPQVQQLHQKISTLEQRLQAQDQASQSQRLTESLSAIEQFANNPAHKYFDNVRDQMATLIESGAAKDIQQAYQQACWGNETIRTLMLAEQQQATQTDEERRRQQHAAEAKRAGGQIAGSPGAGATRIAEVDPSASIEDDIRRSINQLAGRV